MLKRKIQGEILVSLKAKDQIRLDVLRFILSLINYAEIDKHKELTDEEVISVLQKEEKKRIEAVEIFKKAQRLENIEEEQKQIDIIKSFLPVQLSVAELEIIVDETIANASPNPQIGQIIGAVMGELKGKADGSLVASLVRQKLSTKSS